VLVIGIGGGLFGFGKGSCGKLTMQRLWVAWPRPVSAGLLSTEKCAVDMTIGRYLDGRLLYRL